jgi:hypothetical protein
MLAASNEVGDELWAGHTEYNVGGFSPQTSNSIGFLVRGSVNTFVNTSETEESWEHYTSATQPIMLIKKNFVNFGVVSSSDSTLFGAILSKEALSLGHVEPILRGNLSQGERYVIDLDEDQTVSVRKKCKVYKGRDVNTFEPIPEEQLNIDMIPDSEVEVEIEES